LRLRRATLASHYLPSYSLVYARMAWRDKNDRFSVTDEALNLFNDHFYLARFDALFFPTGRAFSMVGRPREFALKAKYNF
jgi:iron complex outermembrane receptor protein